MTIPKLKAPIVLVHGLLGFDRLRMLGWTVCGYFPGVAEALRAAGNRVLTPRLSPTAGIAQRAAELKAFLDREAPGEAVHIIAHSMGGLDSRYLISRLEMAGRVLSLTTIGTPHRGSSFADWGIANLETVLAPFFDFFGVPRQAFNDLTIVSCQSFNEQVPDVPGVRYFSVAGRFHADWLTPLWQVPFRVIRSAEGENDGLVSVVSATYGECCGVWEGDHASLVNWFDPVAQARGRWRDRIPDYTALVQRLADERF